MKSILTSLPLLLLLSATTLANPVGEPQPKSSGAPIKDPNVVCHISSEVGLSNIYKLQCLHFFQDLPKTIGQNVFDSLQDWDPAKPWPLPMNAEDLCKIQV